MRRRVGKAVVWALVALTLIVSVRTLQLIIWAELVALRVYTASSEPQAVSVWLAWLATGTFVVPLSLLWVFLPLLFLNGRLPSRRWRPFTWVVTPYLRIGPVGSYMLYPGPMRVGGTHLWDNPLGSDALAPFGDREVVIGSLQPVGVSLWLRQGAGGVAT